MSNILEVSGLIHCYDGAGESTFHNVNLSLQPGELLAVLGASGSGKSTFLRCIAGLEEPSEGTITIDGVTVVESGRERVPAEHRGIGMVFQDYALFPAMTVRENIAFGVRDPGAAAEAVSRWAKLLRLEELLERRPASLSGGQQQRVALARALAPSPKLLLLDEPFANLDGNLREEVGHELRELFRGGNMAVILVTHDRAEAFALADRVAVFSSAPTEISESSLRQIDAPQVLYRSPKDLEVAQLTGQCSLLPASADADGKATHRGLALSLSNPNQGQIELLVRPDDFDFQPCPDGLWSVLRRVYSGGEYYVWLSDGAVEIRLHIQEDQAPFVGDRGQLEPVRALWCWAKSRG